MKPDQYKALHKLAKLKEGSKASKGAHLVLVHGKSQVEAASMIECSQSTISAAVSKLKEAQRLANHAAIRH